MTDADQAGPPSLEPLPGGAGVRLSGPWTTPWLAELDRRLEALACPQDRALTLDAAGITALDTGGAWMLVALMRRVEGRGCRVGLEGMQESHRELLDLVRSRQQGLAEPQPERVPGWLARVGESAWGHWQQGLTLLAFVGETMVALLRAVAQPRRIRWKALTAILEGAGVDALPIVGLLSFLIGVVIAYQGGIQLRSYGANIFVVELVSVTMLRELAPMMAAIIVAGRTGSAFTAQIGTMKVTEEIDALRTIGIAPMDLLVLPKVFGLVLALPLLSVFADVLGVLGGMVMSAVVLDVSFSDFLARIPQAVSVTSFIIGVGKAPVFAAIIAVVGCFQGFQVSGGADSVGRQTTVSVVQSIFLVIVADAAFSVLFSWLKI